MRWAAVLAVFTLPLAAGCSALPGANNEGYLQVEALGSLDARLQETSGLAEHGGRLWALNDSGNGPWLYRLNTRGGVEKGVRLGGSVNIDWESMAGDEERLYVADCGNNSGRRDWLQLYSVPWQRLEQAAEGDEVPSDRVEFRFADAPRSAGFQAHDNDCEAIARVGSEIWLLTKGWASSRSRLYRLKPGVDRQELRADQEWAVDGLVTGLDYSDTRHELVIVGYTLGRISSDAFVWFVPVDEGEPSWSGARRYLLWPAGQWEAVLWQGNDLLLTRENSLLGEARLGRIRLH